MGWSRRGCRAHAPGLFPDSPVRSSRGLAPSSPAVAAALLAVSRTTWVDGGRSPSTSNPTAIRVDPRRLRCPGAPTAATPGRQDSPVFHVRRGLHLTTGSKPSTIEGRTCVSATPSAPFLMPWTTRGRSRRAMRSNSSSWPNGRGSRAARLLCGTRVSSKHLSAARRAPERCGAASRSWASARAPHE